MLDGRTANTAVSFRVMFMAYLLWGFVVVCGFFMGGASAFMLWRNGFEPVVLGNALLYLGCGVYGLPRLMRLLAK